MKQQFNEIKSALDDATRVKQALEKQLQTLNSEFDQLKNKFAQKDQEINQLKNTLQKTETTVKQVKIIDNTNPNDLKTLQD